MDELEKEINDYLTRYADTLTNYDARAGAALWGMPGTILDDRNVGTIESRETMAQALERSFPLYRKLGLASVGHDFVEYEHLTDAVFLVKVRWLFYDAAGARLTDGTNNYILRRDDDGLRAYVCVPVDESEKVRALADARGVDLSAEWNSTDS
ncbi:hypothetical protein ACFYO1_02675 [Nocardia sp. NPDC006044]|uniref:hypothetical protein n=1 Tax=Nocardia sp. NPDC006044 TaxID=3364306 RepID=UPI003696EA34